MDVSFSVIVVPIWTARVPSNVLQMGWGSSLDPWVYFKCMVWLSAESPDASQTRATPSLHNIWQPPRHHSFWFRFRVKHRSGCVFGSPMEQRGHILFSVNRRCSSITKRTNKSGEVQHGTSSRWRGCEISATGHGTLWTLGTTGRKILASAVSQVYWRVWILCMSDACALCTNFESQLWRDMTALLQSEMRTLERS